LHHIDDLPYDPINSFVINYWSFRKKHQNVDVAKALLNPPAKGKLPFINQTKEEEELIQQAATYIPDLKDDFKFSEEDAKASPDTRNGMKWTGGENEGLKRLEYYLKNYVEEYKDTRNDLLGADYSSKLAPWIANGSLSIRYIYHQVHPTNNP